MIGGRVKPQTVRRVDAGNLTQAAAEIAPPPAAAAQPNWSGWSNLWQIPSLMISSALIALGVYAAIGAAPDIDATLALAQQAIASGDFESAHDQLHDVLEPSLKDATAAQQARFHSAAADLAFLVQRAT